MTSGVTSASSGSLVDPEPRSATQSPTLWESNHLLSSTLECGNTDLGLHNGYQILKISRLRPSRRIHMTCICICIWTRDPLEALVTPLVIRPLVNKL